MPSSRRVLSSALFTGAVLVLSACGAQAARTGSNTGDRTSPPSEVASSGQASASSDVVSKSSKKLQLAGPSVYRFDDLTDMLATANAVVEGEVLSVSRGVTKGQHAKYTNRNVLLKVTTLYSGTAPDTITVSEWGWDENGDEITADGWEGSKPGDRLLLYLAKGEEDGATVYWALNANAQFLLADESKPVKTGNGPDAVGEKVKALNPAALRKATVDAKKEVDAKKTPPRKPGDYLPSVSTDPTPPPGVASNPALPDMPK